MDNLPIGTIILGTQMKNLTEAGKAILQPPAEELGKGLRDGLSLLTEPMRHLVETMRIKNKAKEDLLREDYDKRFQAIPKEYLLSEPNLQILEPVLNGAQFCMDNDKLREMFLNLLSLLFDSRSVGKIHPIFSNIINQLSPRDASNLALFKTISEFPIIRYGYRDIKEPQIVTVLYENVFIANPEYQDIDNQSFSLKVLSQLGLVELHYDLFTDNSEYSSFEDSPACTELKTSFNLSIDGISLHRGCVVLSVLGKAFLDIVLPA